MLCVKGMRERSCAGLWLQAAELFMTHGNDRFADLEEPRMQGTLGDEEQASEVFLCLLREGQLHPRSRPAPSLLMEQPRSGPGSLADLALAGASPHLVAALLCEFSPELTQRCPEVTLRMYV